MLLDTEAQLLAEKLHPASAEAFSLRSQVTRDLCSHCTSSQAAFSGPQASGPQLGPGGALGDRSWHPRGHSIPKDRFAPWSGLNCGPKRGRLPNPLNL